MTDPNQYIPDWSEDETTEDHLDEKGYESSYSDADELRDEEDRYDEK